jgi:hypothetical protein
MHRSLAILLLVFLLFQSLWSAAAPYCQHEQDPQVMHLGHHAHEHQDVSADPDDSPLGNVDHADCHVCHGGACAVAAEFPAALVVPPDAPGLAAAHSLPTPTAPLPERPNWARLA